MVSISRRPKQSPSELLPKLLLNDSLTEIRVASFDSSIRHVPFPTLLGERHCKINTKTSTTRNSQHEIYHAKAQRALALVQFP